MRVLALDPGPAETGHVLYENGKVLRYGVSTNETIRASLENPREDLEAIDVLAIEMIASYGMAVGTAVFETCVWIGRFQQLWRDPDMVKRIPRQIVKLHLCHSMRAKDANVRQALIDRLGPVGTKKNPGPLYGVTSHAWAALALAVTVADGAA